MQSMHQLFSSKAALSISGEMHPASREDALRLSAPKSERLLNRRLRIAADGSSCSAHLALKQLFQISPGRRDRGRDIRVGQSLCHGFGLYNASVGQLRRKARLLEKA